MNWTGKLAKFFVENGKLSLLLLLALFAWGTLSFISTPKQYNPKITAPAFQIIVEYPGASKKQTLEEVTKPLENILADIPEVEDIFSVTRQGGISILNVNFYVGEDPDSAKITLNDRIQSKLDLAPRGIKHPMIKSIDPDDVAVLTIALTSEKYDSIKLRKFAFKLRDRLSIVKGTSNIDVIGGRRRELGIVIDPKKISGSFVSISNIEAALRKSNIYRQSGVIKTAGKFIPLEATGVVSREKDLEDIVVVTGDFGQMRIKDIATVKEQTREIEDHVRHVKKKGKRVITGKNIVLLSIAKLKGTNITMVTDRVVKTLEDLKKGFIPGEINAEVIVNEGDIAAAEIGGLVKNLATAIIIVVIVLLLFLNMRAAGLVAMAIPLTLASVFGLAFITGQNINRITLFALILSLGLLVDNATVVIENIVRRLSFETRISKIEIIINSVNEVGPALVMSTITTVLAFFPMFFVTGMMGPYMGPIPFFVPAALILSLLISFTINPWFASVVLKKETIKGKTILPGILAKGAEYFNNFGSYIFESYHRFLHSLLINKKKRIISLGVIGFVLVVSLLLPAVKLVKFRMLPKADRKQFFLYIDLPVGTPLEETYRVSKDYEKLLLDNRDIIMTQSYVGRPPILDFNALFKGVVFRKESHQATIRVGLTDPEERDIPSEDIVLKLRPGLISAAKKISPGKKVKLKLIEDPPGPPVLSTLLLRVQGYDEQLIKSVIADITPEVNNVKEVVDTDTSIPEDSKTLQVKIDHFLASQSRLSPKRIADTLKTLYSGKIVGIYHNQENIEQEYIVMRLGKKFRTHKSVLNKIYMYNDLGIKVALKDVVKIIETDTVKSLRRENRISTSYIYGDMGKRSVTYAAIDLLFFLKDYKLPDGKGRLINMSLFGADYKTSDGKNVRISLGGEWELTLEVFRDLGIAMGVAVFLIYFVLVGKFKSFKEPVIIMSTIPLSLIGVMPGFMVLGYTIRLYFSATSMIGVIALAGIAVNNSIILLEYLNAHKKEGKILEEAILDAAKTRFRPIMLTTVTTILGSFTIAGDPVWSGLAYAIILGLGVSSILTIIVFPVLYFMICGKEWKNYKYLPGPKGLK